MFGVIDWQAPRKRLMYGIGYCRLDNCINLRLRILIRKNMNKNFLKKYLKMDKVCEIGLEKKEDDFMLGHFGIIEDRVLLDREIGYSVAIWIIFD